MPVQPIWHKSSHSGDNSNCVEVALIWRTSSYSGVNSECVEVGLPTWHKSTHSGDNSDCVEVTTHPAVAVRDTKDRTGGTLHPSAAAWTALLTTTR